MDRSKLTSKSILLENIKMFPGIRVYADAESNLQDVIPDSSFGAVSCVCHFFTKMNF